jgi:hypothetical protein
LGDSRLDEEDVRYEDGDPLGRGQYAATFVTSEKTYGEKTGHGNEVDKVGEYYTRSGGDVEIG